MKSDPQRTPWFRAAGFGCVAVLALAFVHGCGQTVEVGLDDPLSIGAVSAAGGLQLGGFSGGGVSSGTGGSVGAAGATACVVTLCRGQPYKCGNCMDDDGDGLIDALDPDCLGPCDDDELGLSTGLATNEASPCREDCYFDGDNGPGNDKCLWSHACDPLSVEPRCKYGSEMGVDCAGLATTQVPACTDVCEPLVPNGCDCFGCCELQRGSGQFRFIGVGRGALGCQRDKLDDLVACPACTQVHSCINECDTCETCVSGPPTDPTCDPSGACPAGGRACGPDAPCDTGDYCVTGCCVQAPPPT